MLWLVLIVIAAVVFFVYRAKKNKAEDQPLTLETVKTEVRSTLDVNKDGVVNVADAVAAGKKAAGKAKTAAKKAKSKLKVAK